MKVAWPMSAREALVHYFFFEYFQDDLIIVLVNMISDVSSIDKAIHGFSNDGIPEAKDVVRIDLVGDFALQKLNNEEATLGPQYKLQWSCLQVLEEFIFRTSQNMSGRNDRICPVQCLCGSKLPIMRICGTIANMDMKLDFVPPSLINFKRFSGLQCLQTVASVTKCYEDYSKALGDPSFSLIREAFYTSDKSGDVLEVHELESEADILRKENLIGGTHYDTHDIGLKVHHANDQSAETPLQKEHDTKRKAFSEIKEESERITYSEEGVKAANKCSTDEFSDANGVNAERTIPIRPEVEDALRTLEKVISVARQHGFNLRSNEDVNLKAEDEDVNLKAVVDVKAHSKEFVLNLEMTSEKSWNSGETNGTRHLDSSSLAKEVNHNKVVLGSPWPNVSKPMESNRVALSSYGNGTIKANGFYENEILLGGKKKKCENLSVQMGNACAKSEETEEAKNDETKQDGDGNEGETKDRGHGESNEPQESVQKEPPEEMKIVREETGKEQQSKSTETTHRQQSKANETTQRQQSKSHPQRLNSKPSQLSAFNEGHLKEYYNLGRKLGQGQFGTTFLCIEKGTEKEFACKSIAERKLMTIDDVDDVKREIQIMHHMSGNPNVISIKGSYEDSMAVHVVMELCAGGELFDRIVKRGYYSERKAAEIARTVVSVVEACNATGVMHRDLKPENFLFVNQEEDSPLKAIDFGLSIFFKPGHPWVQVDGVAPVKPLDSVVLSRMKQFSAMDKLKKMALRVIAQRLSEEEIAGLKEMFKMIDTDGSGQITYDELKEGLKKFGANLAESEFHALMQAADINNSGTIDYEEFVTATLHLNKIEREDNLLAAFSYFERDGSDYITPDELQKACQEFGIEDIRLDEIMKEVDADNDGRIDYNEFIAMMLPKVGKKGA
ncbi:hypothetical protein F3Y22_tig00110303pilonHSYRG00339 [Hibiscus syriacus]|uniref:non-specific serine/threonine protein kinase n=1 Tax=Hibiscus syriacus TaxID=106335 RepID=A0A6A3B799_HIBSY|nr:hypothetical protein F3Y22_tig00110303pilonHSYRG00339 [Hibiscus syriacus]